MNHKKTCKVCGFRFELLKENKYLASESKSLSDALTKAAYIYECYDCPKCGCQMSVNIRMPKYEGRNDDKTN